MFKSWREKYWLGESVWVAAVAVRRRGLTRKKLMKKKQKAAQDAAKIKALEKENEALKKRIKQLEDKLKKLKK